VALRVSLVIISPQIFANSGSVRFTAPCSSFLQRAYGSVQQHPRPERTKFY
jgi:hypothetical protein